MIAYRVQVRTGPTPNTRSAESLTYLAAFETENEALEATLSNIPDGWTVTAVLGEASAEEIECAGLEAGDVKQAG